MLDALAQGLRSAGGILSPGVSKQLDDERELAMRQEQAKRAMIAQRIIAGVEQGAIDPNMGRQQLAAVGFGNMPEGALGPTPESQARMAQLERQKRKEAFLASPEVQAMIDRGEDEKLAQMMYGRGFISSEELVKLRQESRKANELRAFRPGDVLFQGGTQVGAVPQEQWSAPVTDPDTGMITQTSPRGEVRVLRAPKGRWSDPEPGPNGSLMIRNLETGETKTILTRERPISISTPRNPIPVADSNSPTGFSYQDPSKAVGMPAPRQGVNPQTTIRSLRNDFMKDEAVKRYEQMSPVWNTSLSYMTELSKGGKPNPPADRALIRSFLKITDPSGQIAVADERNAQKFAGLPDRVIQGVVNTIEGQMLPDSVRADLFKELKRRWDELSNRRNIRAEDVRQLAEKWGIDPDDVIRPDPERAPAAPGQRTFRVLGPEK